MRITELHLDGYGLFHQFSLENNLPGMNIVYGPNEAGKTTLMHFINCILFGFERDSNSSDFHPPLRGGEHGGRIVLAFDNGEMLTVSRHTTTKNTAPPVVTRVDGTTMDPAEFNRLLGNISKVSYANFFSFGLDELRRLDIKGSELGTQLYSAGLSGRGRPIAEVFTKLDQERSALWRPRSSKASVNGLLPDLNRLRQELSQLKQAPKQYSDLVAEQARLASEIAKKEEESESALRNLTYHQNLLEAWPNWLKLQEVNAELERNYLDRPLQEQYLDISTEVAALDIGLPGLVANLDELKKLQTALSLVDERIKRAVRELGLEWSVAKVCSFSVGRLTKERARMCAKEIAAARDCSTRRGEEAKRCKGIASEREKIVHNLELKYSAAQAKTLDSEKLAADKRLMTKATWLLDRHKVLQNDLDRLYTKRDFLQGKRSASYIGLVLPWLLAAVVAVWLLGVGWAVPGWTLACISLVGIIMSTFTHRKGTEGQEGSDNQLKQVQTEMEQVLEEWSQIAEALEMSHADLVQSTITEIRDKLVKAETAQGHAEEIQSELARAREDLAQTNAELTEVAKKFEQAQKEVSTAEETWAQWLEELGLPLDLDVDGLMSIIGSIEEIQGYDEQKKELDRKIAEVRKGQEAVLAKVNQLHSRFDLPTVNDPREIAGAVLALRDGVNQAAAAYELRSESELLRERILLKMGSKEDSAALWSQLESADEPTISARADSWVRRVQEVKAELDALKQEAGALNERIATLEKADDFAAKSLEYSLKEECLQREAQRWLEYSVVSFALGKAKAKYEREKQPAIMKAASEYFSEVTQGRYLRVVKPVDDEGLYVETADRKQIYPHQLSRGTLEQLYLCLRLALVEHFAQEYEAMPLIMDDILVNMDRERFNQTRELIAEIARKQQVFFFTCHDSVAEALQKTTGEGRIIYLADGSLEGSGPSSQGQLAFS